MMLAADHGIARHFWRTIVSTNLKSLLRMVTLGLTLPAASRACSEL